MKKVYDAYPEVSASDKHHEVRLGVAIGVVRSHKRQYGNDNRKSFYERVKEQGVDRGNRHQQGHEQNGYMPLCFHIKIF